jgi:DNA-binding transcriptional regulator YiaG
MVVSGLQQSACSSCGETFVLEAQHDFNASLIEQKSRTEQFFVNPGFIRSFRERFSLSQRSASKLFGAGASAFGKWESGQLPSGPAALLLQAAMHVPGVTQFLASLADVEVAEAQEGLSWQTDVPSASQIQRKLTLRRIELPPSERSYASDESSDFTLDELYGQAA